MPKARRSFWEWLRAIDHRDCVAIIALPIVLYGLEEARSLSVFVLAVIMADYAASHYREHTRRVRADRFRRGLCLDCGYDLRGGHERCPECGRLLRPTSPSTSVVQPQRAKLERWVRMRFNFRTSS
jgi:hypothetical protein